MNNIFKGKVQFIQDISDIMLRGVSDEREHLEFINKIIEVMSLLEASENKIAELEHYKDAYYKIEHDSEFLKGLLDIVDKSSDKENILAEYEKKIADILDDDIPF